MSIVKFPENTITPQERLCAICQRQVKPEHAVIGAKDAEGNLAFLCSGHYWDAAKLINGWADLMATGRIKAYYEGQGQDVGLIC